MSPIPLGAKVTFPTRPWLVALSPFKPAQYAHAPSFYASDPQASFALCRNATGVSEPAGDLPACPECIRVLTRHDLWPL